MAGSLACRATFIGSVGAVHMTAGPDGFRESSPYQFAGIIGFPRDTSGSLDPSGSTDLAITHFCSRKLAALHSAD